MIIWKFSCFFHASVVVWEECSFCSWVQTEQIQHRLNLDRIRLFKIYCNYHLNPLKKPFTFQHPYCNACHKTEWPILELNTFRISWYCFDLDLINEPWFVNLFSLISATLPLWDRTQAGHDVSHHGSRHVSRASWPRRLRAWGGDQHLGHHRQPEQGDHQGDQVLSHRGKEHHWSETNNDHSYAAVLV